MGTRSLVKFVANDGQVLTTIYSQYDGYPDGRGQALADFLKSKTIVNGIGSEDHSTIANGVECLAAQWIAHEKTDVGGVYIYSPAAKDVWEEYTYFVHASHKTGIKLECFSGERLIFSGQPKDFDGKKLDAEAA